MQTFMADAKQTYRCHDRLGLIVIGPLASFVSMTMPIQIMGHL